MYARLMRERFGANDASCRLRFHTQTGGVTLQAQQPLNNVVRVTVQALAAVLGGTQSLHTNGYDEALALPDRRGGDARAAHAADRRLRERRRAHGRSAGRQLLRGAAHRPRSKPRRSTLLERVDELGGAAAAIEAGFFQEEIGAPRVRAPAARRARRDGDRRREPLHGRRGAAGRPAAGLLRARAGSARASRRRARSARRRRGATSPQPSSATRAASYVEVGAATQPELMPLIIDAVRARASVGEISDVLRARWGAYRPGG